MQIFLAACVLALATVPLTSHAADYPNGPVGTFWLEPEVGYGWSYDLRAYSASLSGSVFSRMVRREDWRFGLMFGLVTTGSATLIPSFYLTHSTSEVGPTRHPWEVRVGYRFYHRPSPEQSVQLEEPEQTEEPEPGGVGY